MRLSARKLTRIAMIVAVNLLVFLLLFAVAEFTYRAYREGVTGAFVNLINGSNAPFSNLGTGNWIISDKVLGYRLNPNRPEVNSLSVRHKEIAIPKPEGLYRVMFLGDSVAAGKPGFVSFTRDKLSQEGDFEVTVVGRTDGGVYDGTHDCMSAAIVWAMGQDGVVSAPR